MCDVFNKNARGLNGVMWDYFVTHYIELQYGWAFPVTEIEYIIGIILILSPKIKKKSDIIFRVIKCVVLWILITCGSSLIEKYFDWTIKIYILMPGLIALYAVFCSKLPWNLRAVYGLLYYSVFLYALSLSAYLGRVSSEEIAIKNLVTSLSQILLLFGMIAYLRFCGVEKYNIVPKYCSLLIVVIVCIYIVVHELLASVGDIKVYVETGFIVIELVAFQLYHNISRLYDEKIKLNIMYLKREKESYVMEVAHSEIEKMKELRHDMKNHLTFMSYLVNEGRTEELKEYLAQYSTEVYDVLRFSLCGNYVIDYILNFEIGRAKACGVSIDYKIFIPPQLPFDDKDLCSLLTNILDNAIEAAAKMPEKTIDLKLEWKNDVFFISCSNATDRFSEGEIGSHISTTKRNREVHGCGMKIINSIVKKYNGTIKITVKDGKFWLSLYLGWGDVGTEKTSGKTVGKKEMCA